MPKIFNESKIKHILKGEQKKRASNQTYPSKGMTLSAPVSLHVGLLIGVLPISMWKLANFKFSKNVLKEIFKESQVYIKDTSDPYLKLYWRFD